MCVCCVGGSWGGGEAAVKIFTLSSVGCHAVICFLVATRTNNRRSNSPTNQQTAALSEGQTERRQAQLEANSGGEN